MFFSGIPQKIFFKSQNNQFVPLLTVNETYTGLSSQKVFIMPLGEFILFGT